MARSSSLIYYILYIAIGFLYPAYCSLVALQTKDKNDDAVWLIYWVVFAVFTFVELVGDFIFFWLPLYPILKLLFLLWCAAPIGKNGAFYIYKVFIEPFFNMYGGHIDYAFTHIIELAKSSSHYIASYTK